MLIFGVLLVSIITLKISAGNDVKTQLLLQDLVAKLQRAHKPNRAEFKAGALAKEPSLNRLSSKNHNNYNNRYRSSAVNNGPEIEELVHSLQSKLQDILEDRDMNDRSAPSKDETNQNSLLQSVLKEVKREHQSTRNSNQKLQNMLKKLVQSKSQTVKKSKRGRLIQPGNLIHGKNVDLDKYSRIFIILNPQALEDQPSATPARQATMPRIRKKRYFYHTQGTTLRSRDNQEHKNLSPRFNSIDPEKEREVVIYADWRRRDDGSSEHAKGKRSRGGEGGSYRTAMPVIGHKGDIYEKDD